MYPANGTVYYEDGNKIVTDTSKVINLPVVLPVAGVALIFVVIALFCICAYYRAREDANESVDVAMDNSGFRNINNTNTPLDEEGPTTSLALN